MLDASAAGKVKMLTETYSLELTVFFSKVGRSRLCTFVIVTTPRRISFASVNKEMTLGHGYCWRFVL